jgi:hypothetical protein
MKQHRLGESIITGEREFNSLGKSADLKIQTMAGPSRRWVPAYRLIVIITIINLLFFINKACSQWRPLVYSYGTFTTIYFLNSSGPPRIGFAGATDTVFRTEDGGKTWEGIPISSNYNTLTSDFAFKDSLTGWLAADGSAVSGFSGAYKTTDGGKSWKFLPGSESAATGIYYNPTNGELFLSTWGTINTAASTFVSWDEGLTWSPIPASFRLDFSGFAFNDSLHGIIP